MAIDPSTGLEQTQTAQPQIPIYQAPAYTPGQSFQFDPNKYLPGIQQQASAIYNPQQAQIEALQKLQTSQTEQARITTKEDFAKEMTRRIEAINARGAFFGGGALTQQADIATRETRALQDINTQDQAAQAGFLAQRAGLNAAQAEYIQEKLSGAQGSAYSMYKDQYGMYQDQQDRLFRQQQYDRDIFESDRAYQLQLKQIKADKKLSKSQRKKAEKEAKEAKRQFDAEMAYKYASLNKKKSESDNDDPWNINGN